MKHFVPLESSPEVFNNLLALLDVSGVEFQDIWSLDPEMLAFLPRPILAVLLVFPISPAYEAYRSEADANVPEYDLSGDKEKARWYRQTIVNSCGTMALLHAISNVVPTDSLGPVAAKIVNETRDLSPEERANYLENSTELENAHAAVAGQGDTEAPEATAEIDFHYVCLAAKDGELVELDGRRKGPVFRGKLDGEDVLCPLGLNVIQEFLQRESDNSFSMIGLVRP